MLDVEQIESFYPEHLRPFKKNLLREYLQYKILEAVFDSSFGEKLVFMGGTATRMVYQNDRFSEDLDFDNRGLSEQDFENMVMLIVGKLRLEGYILETKTVFKGAFRCYLKVANVLFESGISGHRDEKLLIQIDTEPQHASYSPEKVILNKFDVFLRINVVPADILLAQKIYAILKRKRFLGRDFYDAVFLFGRARPNLDYLRLKLKIKSMAELKKFLVLRCKGLDFGKLASDVEPFLFAPSDSKKVRHFQEYLNSLKL